ncbi:MULTISPECIES: glycohydrolase toxin TNT-related protein [Pectobacterium]|uniref:glycohydrolase toxin TNT-related protein n=1 Tax=Pectobacterium TaxID=122277 RepID=UPI003815FEB4
MVKKASSNFLITSLSSSATAPLPETVAIITVDTGDIKGWFGYEGGGTQHELPDKIINLVRDGSFKRW